MVSLGDKPVIVTGASGLLGREVLDYLANEGWNVVGFAFSRADSDPSLRKVDLTDADAVAENLRSLKPSAVVHCAAEKSPDAAEKQPEETKRLNVDATTNLARLCRELGAFFIYISTDYVFDGNNPPYDENSTANPVNKYGESKLAGEKATLQEYPDAAVLRVPVLYGPVKNLAESAVTVLFEKLIGKRDKPVSISDYELRYPTHTRDVAAAISVLLRKRIVENNREVRGIYHWSADDCMTKYTMVVEMGRIFGLPTDHIKADKEPSGGATRPKDAAVRCTRLKELGAVVNVPFSKGIEGVLRPFAS